MAPPQLTSEASVPETEGAGGGGGGGGSCARRFFTWEEVALRTGRIPPYEELWLVVERKVYDVSRFYQRHPGGARVIRHYAGQDATDAFMAFHLDKNQVSKYLKPLLIGELAPDQSDSEPNKNQSIIEDFRKLRSTVEKTGLLKPNRLFFSLIFLHIVLLDIGAWLTIWYFGSSLVPVVIGVALYTTAQCQMNWFQHDLGHLSVFSKSKWNHRLHLVIMCLMKGLAAKWWNNLHFQHHAKPNCFRKDPDLNMHPFLFVLGKKLATELGVQKKKFMPYNHQHKYFFISGPSVMLPFFQFSVLYFSIKRKQWLELTFLISYYIRICLMYIPIMGLKCFMIYCFLTRVLEIWCFTWVSQMNHIPMHIDYDENTDWMSTQLQATCNVDQSFFNDWFTGHLNFQIEHHLFPTMPRHNFWKVAPQVKSLCAKHRIDYQCKPLLTAFGDIVRSLKDSGQTWYDAYMHG